VSSVTGTPVGGAAPPDEDGRTRLSAGRYHSFVIRVFSRGAGRGIVHGQVTHVASRRTLRFRDLQSIVAFIRAHVDRRPSDAGIADREVAKYGDG
jgi:hypothetical protein